MLMKKLYRLLRYDWPVHFMLRLTNVLPDNVVFFRLRGALVRPFLGACGANLRLGRNITLYNPANIHLGNNIYIAYGGWFMAGEVITVGDEVLFGPYCVVVSSNHTRVNRSFRYGPPKLEPITIGKGSWIGAGVTLTAGTVIGQGSVVAAGAVVCREIPSDVLAGGVPACVIKTIQDE